MAKHEQFQYEARAKVFKALAHPVRLRLINEIDRHGERCVCDLTAAVGLDMSTVSRHLSQLREAGILTHDKRGTTIVYRLRIKCLDGFLRCVDSVLQAEAKRYRETLVRPRG